MSELSDEKLAPGEHAGEDLGFGTALTGQRGARLINRDGTFNVLRNRKDLTDHLSYAALLNVSWPAFFGLVVCTFFLINLVFGIGYLLCGRDALVAAGTPLAVGRIWQAFIFSVDTFSTIGYGNVVPVGRVANLLVAFEAVAALLNAALVTGLVFARFSKPNIRIEFSASGVVRLGTEPAVLVRLRNLTRNEVLEVEATLIAWFRDPDDPKVRRFHILPLERGKVTFLPLSWTVAHFITPESPFHGLTKDTFQQTFGEIILQIRGMDQNGSQAIYARASYTVDEMVWNARFADQYTHDPSTGVLGIDSARFHLTEPFVFTEE